MITPARFGPYRVVARLGAGGMAEVFVAERLGASGFCKRVAIKAVRPEHADEAELQHALVAESKLGAAMDHPNLVGVLDLGIDQGRYYAVLELVDGIDLQRALASGPPPAAVALLVIDEVAAALDYLHGFCDSGGRALGLVHRDVSSSNVLLSRTGAVKLADYGLAKPTLSAAQTQGRVLRGKFGYLSPEQIAGAPLDGRSDMFALGVMLVELMTGRRPHEADDAAQTIANIRDGVAVELDAMAPAIAAVARRCLAQAREQRFGAMAALRDALAVARRELPCDRDAVARWVVGAVR